MFYLVVKAAISGLLIAVVSEVARRNPGWGGLLASLPLVSVLAMVWLWRDTQDAEQVARLATGAFWFFLPSIPLFLIIPLLLRSGMGFWASLAIGCGVTMVLYAAMAAIAPRIGIEL